MFTGSIPISQLDQLGAIVSTDFFPLDQSSSLTTFRVSISTLNNWFTISGSCLTASWASASLSSSYALTASYAIFGTSASYALTSTSASYAITASEALLALSASDAISASYALVATSASWAPFTQSVQISASYASASLSSSYALSASYAPALADTVPIGTVMAYAAQAAPNNWLECNGAALSTASFAQLFSAIGNNNPTASFGYLCDQFGNFNLSGSFFKIPDLRAYFVRGWDHNRGIDTGRVFGSNQNSQVQNHSHSISNTTRVQMGQDNGVVFGIDAQSFQYGGPFTKFTDNSGGGTESRPINTALMYCIKYSNVTNFATTGITLAGDVVGTSSATLVQAIRGTFVSTIPPTQGQVLQYSTQSGWTPQTLVSYGLVAWATIIIPTASNYSSDNINVVNNGNNVNKPYILNGFNVADASWTGATINPDPNFLGNRPLGRTKAMSGHNLLITLATPSVSNNYMLVGTCFEQDNEYGAVTFYPWQTRTNTQFTMSFGGGPDFSGGSEYDYITILIYAS